MQQYQDHEECLCILPRSQVKYFDFQLGLALNLYDIYDVLHWKGFHSFRFLEEE